MEKQRYTYSGQPAHDRAKWILVVDDEQPILALLRDVLEEEGYNVIAARNGLEALHIATNSPVNLLLTDYMMPQLNGWELITALRANPVTAELPMLLMSAVHVPADGSYDALIRKPFDIAHVLQQVEHYLRQSSSAEADT